MIPRSMIFGLIGLLAVAIAAATAALSFQRYTPYAQARIGGSFTMEDANGHRVTEADLAGKPSAIFFGYTSCPDVCPTTLASLTEVLGRMGSDADAINVVFASVDPLRDTPERLRDYLSSFDGRIRGLTGTQPEADAMAAAYHVFHRWVAGTNGDYTVDHSATISLMGADGHLVGEIAYGEDATQMQAKLTALARSTRPAHPGTRTDLWAEAARFAKRLCGL